MRGSIASFEYPVASTVTDVYCNSGGNLRCSNKCMIGSRPPLNWRLRRSGSPREPLSPPRSSGLGSAPSSRISFLICGLFRRSESNWTILGWFTFNGFLIVSSTMEERDGKEEIQLIPRLTISRVRSFGKDKEKKRLMRSNVS